jgi:hypothetical protein
MRMEGGEVGRVLVPLVGIVEGEDERKQEEKIRAKTPKGGQAREQAQMPSLLGEGRRRRRKRKRRRRRRRKGGQRVVGGRKNRQGARSVHPGGGARLRPARQRGASRWPRGQARDASPP